MNGNSYLPARLLQVVGILLLIASFVFWLFTDRESVLLTGAAMSLILLGAYRGAIDTLTKKNGNGKRE